MTSNQSRNVIDIINSFPFSTDFVDWISNGTFVFSILSETNNNRTYTRSTQFTARNRLIINGIIKLLKNSIDERILNDFLKIGKPIGQYITLNPESFLSKQNVNKTVTGNSYHQISHIFYKNDICGHCSELFHMDNISHLLSEKQPQILEPIPKLGSMARGEIGE